MRNWIGRGLAASLVFSCFVGSTESTQAQQWANLEVTFIYDGAKVPERKALDMSKDPACTKAGVDELLVVNPENKGIQNVALWVDNKKTKLDPASIHPDLKEVPQNKILLDNLNCIFAPHFIVVRAGGTIEVKNSDTTGHNANFSFLNNDPVNFIVPAGSSKDLKLKPGLEEPGIIPVNCNVHPWMEAKLLVIDHPYGAVSDANGVLKIEKLPAGKKITFRLFHESQAKAIDEIDADGKKMALTKGNFEMELKPGDTKLKVKISDSKFKVK